jgi:hypothetical protein
MCKCKAPMFSIGELNIFNLFIDRQREVYFSPRICMGKSGDCCMQSHVIRLGKNFTHSHIVFAKKSSGMHRTPTIPEIFRRAKRKPFPADPPPGKSFDQHSQRIPNEVAMLFFQVIDQPRKSVMRFTLDDAHTLAASRISLKNKFRDQKNSALKVLSIIAIRYCMNQTGISESDNNAPQKHAWPKASSLSFSRCHQFNCLTRH